MSALPKNKETLGRNKCRPEIDVLFEVCSDYAKAVDVDKSDAAVAEASHMVLACNDVLYKKLIAECAFTFDEGEAFVQLVNLEALNAAKASLQ